MLKWILGGLAVLLLGGLMFFIDGDALARQRALDDGTAEARTAVMRVGRDRPYTNRRNRHVASFADTETGKRLDSHWRAAGWEGTVGLELREHSGDEVTVYLYDDEVIAVRLKDGELFKGDDVGWRGLWLHWGLAVLALGLVLLAASVVFGGSGLGSVGVVMALLGGVTFLFVTFPWAMYIAGALLLALVGVVVWAHLTRDKSGASEDAGKKGKNGKKKAKAKRG